MYTNNNKKAGILMEKNNYRKIFSYIGLIGLTTYLAACGADTVSQDKAKEDDYVLKIAESSDLCSAPQQIAIEQGFFDEEGLKYELVKVGEDTNNFTAISTGQIDASNSLIGSIIQPLANGAEIKVTTGLHTGCLQVLVKSDSNIKNAEDLKGKKIGVSSVAGSPATFAKRYLGDNGINVSTEKSEVEFVAYNSSDLALVLENGTVDAIALGDPSTEIIKDEYGFETLASNATTLPYDEEYCCVAYVSNEVANKHPEVAKKFTQAIQKASAWIDDNKDETVQIQLDQKYIDGDKVTNLRSLESYNFIPSVEGAKAAFVQVGEDLKDLGIIEEGVDIKKLQENSFLDLELDKVTNDKTAYVEEKKSTNQSKNKKETSIVIGNHNHH